MGIPAMSPATPKKKEIIVFNESNPTNPVMNKDYTPSTGSFQQDADQPEQREDSQNETGYIENEVVVTEDANETEPEEKP
jgi:hypothetical protein